ncbi:hypothetical protein [Gaopeijia maritima]|uniref:CcmD family protein n=1 Tax=Gaopeijia maritima TaxID=3119007 RepID=A0ABU9EC51_9BACT
MIRSNRPGSRLFAALLLALPVALLLPIGSPVLAQASELGRQTLGRAYWHVFAAYAIGLLLIGGWVVSIARRLARLERKLPDGEG